MILKMYIYQITHLSKFVKCTPGMNSNENTTHCKVYTKHLLNINVNGSVWSDNKRKLYFFKVEILSIPLSSGFTGKYFFSVDISSGFGANKKNKVHTFKKIILERKKQF